MAFNFLDGFYYIRIGAAAADIAAHELPDLRCGMSTAFIDKGYCGHDLTRGAIAALESIVFDECLLHGVQFLIPGEAFDGGHLFAFIGDGKAEAGVDADPIYMYGA